MTALVMDRKNLIEHKKRIRIIIDNANKAGPEVLREVQRQLCKTDLWFLLRYIISRPPEYMVDSVFCEARCMEVQNDPDGHLDLWARGHLKSTIITYARTIQDILNDPEVTIGIFSFTKPIAKGFLKQIKREFESNELLKSLFPEILYNNPKTESPKWSEDEGIIVKRQGNPKESTVEAWGLTDGQPTSKHFAVAVYDDVITRDSVTTPEMIAKVTSSWELSLNLIADNGRRRYVGTRYDYADTYRTILDRGAAVERRYPAEIEGVPTFKTREQLEEAKRDMGTSTYASQMLLEPKAGSSQSFDEAWLRWWDAENLKNLNIYIIVDPASKRKKNSDYTSMIVLGMGADLNYYVIDIVAARMNLSERTEKLFDLQRMYRPKAVGYEQYGMQVDIEHIEGEMKRKNFHFKITEMGGNMAKEDRIARLVPFFEANRIFIPKECWHDGINTVSMFLEQYNTFPFCSGHDDILDNLANICRLKMTEPDVIADSVALKTDQGGDIYGFDDGYEQ